MSHGKGGRGGGSAKGKKAGAGSEEKPEDVLQAVVLADAFEDRFKPFTLEKPRCLLPLANTPLIEYTLEFLALNGVQEVFVYCGNHMDQVESYISESPRWSPSGRVSPFSNLEFVRVNDATSPGDFLRDLDKRGLISGDFILVNGDLVSNIELDDALTAHRRRREANRDAIMTMVLREAGEADHRAKAHGITPVFAVDAKNGRCLHYEEINPLQTDRYLHLDPYVLEHGEVDIRADLIDCQIDICTPEVLALWSDSFDYESLRKNFLHGVLKDWELNGKLIHTEIVNKGYGVRASNLQLYEAVSRDVLGRWTFPLVPDNNLVSGQSYTLRSGSVYSEKGVKLEADVQVTKAVLGMKTTVGTGSRIRNSVIGRRCHIGSNVHIENSFIWDDATIEDGTRISRSVVAESATIGKDCTIAEGSLISFGVQISDGITLPSTTLSLFTELLTPVEPDTTLLGPSGKGAVYKSEEEDEDDDEGGDRDPTFLQKSLIYSTAHLNISASSISTFNSAVSDDDEDDDGHHNAHSSGDGQGLLTPDPTNPRSRLSSFTSEGSGSGGATSTAFHADAVASLVDALRTDEASDLDAAKLEFMGLRLANDASNADVRRAVATALVRRAAELVLSPTSPLEPAKAAARALTAKKGTDKFVSEVGLGGESSTHDQSLFILALQRAVVSTRGLEPTKGGTLLAALLQQLYNVDVLEEESIMAWWNDKGAVEGGEKMVVVRGRCQILIDWLLEDDEDDDDEEDDSD